MESYVVNVFGREEGYLQQDKTVARHNGLILSINNEVLPQRHQAQNVKFVHMAFDVSGHRLVASDYHGTIYVFDLRKNRFWVVCQLGLCSSAISFTPNRGHDIIVAFSDCSVVCLDSESKKIQKRMSNHKTCVCHISVDRDGQRILTSSLEQAIIWNSHTFSVLHNLTLRKEVDILKVFFLPVKDHIVSAFKDGSVFLWNSITLNCLNNFISSAGEKTMGLKTIDGSKDGKLLVCGGKANWILLWSVETGNPLYTISFANCLTSVKYLVFISSPSRFEDQHLLSLVSLEGTLLLYNIDTAEHIYQLCYDDQKIVSEAVSGKGWKIATLTSLGNIKVYDMIEILGKKAEQPERIDHDTVIPEVTAIQKKILGKMQATKKEASSEVGVDRFNLILKEYGEYPSKYRFFIWSELLKLPRNHESFAVLLEQGIHSLCLSLNMDFPIENGTLKRAFQRIMSMLVQWCPLMKEIDYIPFLVFPFIKLLHKNIFRCFELVLTIISSWCQNWFIYCPFPSFNILCTVENILLFHDKILFTHFILHDVTSQVYAWPLLNTAFSDVFNKESWMKLWDHIFTNSTAFLLYVVVAYSIVSRQVLLRCVIPKDFKEIYQKQGVSISSVIKEAYRLQKQTPIDVDPSSIIGPFNSLPRGGYPVFNKIPKMEVDLQVHTRNKIIRNEIDYLQQRQAELELEEIAHEKCYDDQESPSGGESRLQSQIWEKHMHELQRLQSIRKKLLLQEVETEPPKIYGLENRLKRIQKLIQKHLTDQVVIFNYETSDSEDVATETPRKAPVFDSKPHQPASTSLSSHIKKSVKPISFFEDYVNNYPRKDLPAPSSMEAVKNVLVMRQQMAEADIKKFRKET